VTVKEEPKHNMNGLEDDEISRIEQFFASGNFEKAKEAISDTIKQNPNSPDLLNRVAHIIFQMGDIGGAKEALSDILKLCPDHIETLHDLALIEMLENDYEKAKNTLKNILQIDPANDAAIEKLQFMEAVSEVEFPKTKETGIYDLGNSSQENQIPRNTKRGSLDNLRNLGFYPRVVIDVGAQIGTLELYEVFPQSKHLMIEPVKEHEPQLLNICRQLPDAEVIIAAATTASGTVNLSVTPNFKYASIVNTTNEETDKNYRTIEAIALDDVCRERHLQGPYLIKIDVDGLEVDVLRGAVHILNETEYVIVESTLFGQLYDVMDFLRVNGFVAYDIVDSLYRPTDLALWQVDIAFVKKEGQFRQDKSYGTPEINKILATRPMYK
jgi:FkbM family methyltransferase